MNDRDPFNVRKNNSSAFNLLQSTRSVAQKTVSRVVQTGNTLTTNTETRRDMASSNGGATYRNPDTWQRAAQSQQSGSALGGAISGMFSGDNKQALPMYKDKPYSYPSGKRRPWFKQKRVWVAAVASLTGLFWWLGLFPSIPGGSSRSVKAKSSTRWGLLGSKDMDWDHRAEAVKDVFKLSFADYEKHAWGFDEYHPASKGKKQMTPNGMGWIIVDALDTMMLMNLTTELTHARQWIKSSLTYDQDHDVNTFETTIRMLGGLLSAHYLSTEFPGRFASVDDGLSDDLYIEKATDLADRLLGAFDTVSGVPLASINLHTSKGIASHDNEGASSTAEATTVQLEMKYLARLTGEDHYWDKAEHVMKVIDDNHSPDGLVPIFITTDKGQFKGHNVRLGSRGDSYYEYLIKQYLQTSEAEPIYKTMWKESLDGVKKHLITYSKTNNFTVLGERPNGLQGELSPKMDHLVCFMPGTIALAATGGATLKQARASPSWTKEQEEDMDLAQELLNTCWGMYTTTETGLAGEITHFHIDDPPRMYNDFTPDTRPRPLKNFDQKPAVVPGVESKPIGADDFIVKPSDVHNLQRPETVESLFYMWRITGDVKYREWGWQMFESFLQHTQTQDGQGYSSIGNVMAVPPPLKDNMESFWLAETLKYFYLLFSSNDILPLTDVVFNTEAHAFPRFEMGKLFTTGWARGEAKKVETPVAAPQTITMRAGEVVQTAQETKPATPPS